MPTTELICTTPMNIARSGHGLIKVDRKVFAFGSNDTPYPIKNAEVFDII